MHRRREDLYKCPNIEEIAGDMQKAPAVNTTSGAFLIYHFYD